MIYQNNELLDVRLKKYGCYFLSLLKMVELETGRDFGPEDINLLFADAQRLGYCDIEATILRPDHILSLAFDYLDFNKKIKQVGAIINGITTFWGWVKRAEREYKYKIIHYKTAGTIGHHFVLADREGLVIYDSYTGQNYIKVGKIKEVLYRVFV